MDWGVQNRLSRIIRPESGRTVMLAVDHGYFMGPTTRLEVPRTTIEPLLPFADSLMVTRGVVRSSVAPSTAVPIVLRVSGGASMLADDLSDEGIVTTVKDAVRLNVAAVALSIFIGTAHERESILNLGALVSEGYDYGMPVLAVTAVGKELEKRDARYLGLCCRVAAETGAQIVKTYHCDGFERVVEGCPVPLVVAGGPKLRTELDVFELTSRAVRQGAAGVDMGRNIWQHDAPVAMIKAVRAIVHENASPEDALALFQRVRAAADGVEPAARR